MKLFKLKGISKSYAMRAAYYRRVARNHISGLDYSEAALRQLHAWESRGLGSIDKSINGYAYGKWLIDLSVSMWCEDIRNGYACKAEFLSTPIERLHNTKKLERIPVGTLFAYLNEASL